jgi:hypothetical protein
MTLVDTHNHDSAEQRITRRYLAWRRRVRPSAPVTAVVRPWRTDRAICPQDPRHYLDSHMPGGAWFGHGHDGRPSPWGPL